VGSPWLTVGLVLTQCLRTNGGSFAYTLDDAYIHLAFGKHLARNGVFGVTPHEFASAESSPLWGLILAVFALPPLTLGSLLWVPFGLNLGLATWILIWTCRALECESRRGDALSGAPRASLDASSGLCLLALVFVTPMPWLVFSGMEHLLQAGLALVVASFGARDLSTRTGAAARGLNWRLLLLIAALTATRYEGLYLVAVLGLLQAARGRILTAFATVLSGATPPLLYGAFAVARGWYWLPNSLLLKSRLGDPNVAREIAGLPLPLALVQLHERVDLGLLVVGVTILALGIMVRRRQPGQPELWQPSTLAAVLFVGTTLIHGWDASVG
jgi:hypothetical protein